MSGESGKDIDSILSKVKGGDKSPIKLIQAAQGAVEDKVCALLKEFESASGVRVRYVSITRKSDKKRTGGCMPDSGYNSPISDVEFSIDISKG